MTWWRWQLPGIVGGGPTLLDLRRLHLVDRGRAGVPTEAWIKCSNGTSRMVLNPPGESP